MFDPATSTKAPGRRETVALLAGLMAMNAFAIDAMIPALPAIGDTLGIALDNDRQLVVIAYMLGFGVGQLFWGPLADRFGRKPVLAVGVALYAAFALGCALSSSFALLIGFRIAMGVAAAVTRVLVTAMVRDLFDGPAMAQVMSLIFMVFMVVPVIAPSVGQAILFLGEWHLIFLVLAGYATLMWIWAMTRLPETLHPEFRLPLKPGAILAAARAVVGDRLSLGYTLASTAIFGGLTAYIASIQQIVFDVYHAPGAIGLVFAAVAAPMSLAAYANSRVVTHFGLRHVGHLGMIGFLATAILHLAVAWNGESLASFVALQALLMVSFAFCSANLSTIAMTNMAPIAGTASSVQGLTGSVGGAMIGFVIGRQFDGTTIPFLIGLALCGAAALTIVAITERGQLVRERRAKPASPLPECTP